MTDLLDPIALARALIACPSVTPEDHGALAVMQNALESLGFICTRLPFSQEGEPTVDNLYARLGTGTPHFAFAGHTDVVPVGDTAAWKFPPFGGEVHGEYLYGRGAEDMKGALACMVSAVAAFLKENAPFTGSISFLITGDEEGYAINGTRKMVAWMQERNIVPDCCLVGEPTNPESIGDMVKIGRRGSMNMVLTVRGKQGHVAYPHLADNPVTKLVALLQALKTEVIDEGMEFFQPSNLEVTSIDVGNPAKNVIPGNAEARINIRFNPLHNSADMLAWMQTRCREFLGEGYTLETRVTGEAFLTQPGAFSALLVDAIKAASGKTPVLSTTGGTSDARFIKDLCPVAEFGTTGFTPHMVDERVKVADLRLLSACYRDALQRFFK